MAVTSRKSDDPHEISVTPRPPDVQATHPDDATPQVSARQDDATQVLAQQHDAAQMSGAAQMSDAAQMNDATQMFARQGDAGQAPARLGDATQQIARLGDATQQIARPGDASQVPVRQGDATQMIARQEEDESRGVRPRLGATLVMPRVERPAWRAVEPEDVARRARRMRRRKLLSMVSAATGLTVVVTGAWALARTEPGEPTFAQAEPVLSYA